MSNGWEELKFYGRLIRNRFGPKDDLLKIPCPPEHAIWGNISLMLRPDYHLQVLEWANEYGGICR